MSTPTKALCEIQASRRTPWQTLGIFDLAAPNAEATARQGVELLASLDASTSFRFVARHSGQTLALYSFGRGWVGLGDQPEQQTAAEETAT